MHNISVILTITINIMNNNTLKCYLKFLLGNILSISLLFFLSWKFDFYSLPSDTCIILAILYTLISLLIQIKNLMIFEELKIPLILFSTYIIGTTLVVPIIAHLLVQDKVEIEAINEASNIDAEYFHLTDNAIEKKHKGIYNTFRVRSSKRGKYIEFVSYIVHPFKGTSNAYIGYKITSKHYPADDKNLDSHQTEFIESIKGEIEQFRLPSKNIYLKRIIPGDKDYQDYETAQNFCDDAPNYAVQKHYIYTLSDPESTLSSYLMWFIISVFIANIIFGLGFKYYFKRESEEYATYYSSVTNTIIDYIVQKHILYIIIPMALTVGFYFSMVQNGYNAERFENKLDFMINYGAVNKYLCFARGEVWRLVTAIFVHENFVQMLFDIVGLICCIISIVKDNYTISFRKLTCLFFFFAISSNFTTIVSCGDYETLIGATGGLTGLYVYIFIKQLVKERERQKRMFGDRIWFEKFSFKLSTFIYKPSTEYINYGSIITFMNCTIGINLNMPVLSAGVFGSILGMIYIYCEYKIKKSIESEQN